MAAFFEGLAVSFGLKVSNMKKFLHFLWLDHNLDLSFCLFILIFNAVLKVIEQKKYFPYT